METDSAPRRSLGRRSMQDPVCQLPGIIQRTEKRHASIVRCRQGGCGDGFSGERRAATIAGFLGPLLPKAKSRLTFCPEAIMSASEFTFSSPLSLNLLDTCHSLASPNSGSTHTARLVGDGEPSKAPCSRGAGDHRRAATEALGIGEDEERGSCRARHGPRVCPSGTGRSRPKRCCSVRRWSPRTCGPTARRARRSGVSSQRS
ncbi:MAG: hypothetical protein AVDCRST_MAG58-1997 [uncultured Rubrobacteraceae bacterium]|uniref:Uncharacterized protein n=1 Tax=uncultured Rubrobacteraceae bacterium TaxID=349277 RepID=A0A6J4R6G3_9ACTN|nr:MAG: hypothetical protein AVDCRST_MAG58-1997 [uncultured Rubrobacteraceae bacterium]